MQRFTAILSFFKQKTVVKVIHDGFGAGDRGRTGTGSLPWDFKSQASANSATPAFTIQFSVLLGAY